MHNEHGLHIINFEGDEDDQELYFLLEDLKSIVLKQIENVTFILPFIREKMLKRNGLI